LEGGNKAPQQRRHPSGAEGKSKAEKGVIGGTIGFDRVQLEKSLGVDVDRVGLRALARNRNGYGFALGEQPLHVRIDQAGPELREIQNAEHEREQPGNVQKNDAARETRKNLIDEELPGVTQRANEALGPQDPPGARKKNRRLGWGNARNLDRGAEGVAPFARRTPVDRQ